VLSTFNPSLWALSPSLPTMKRDDSDCTYFVEAVPFSKKLTRKISFLFFFFFGRATLPLSLEN